MTNAEYKCSICKGKYRKTPERDIKNRTRKGCFDIFPTPILSYRPQHTMEGYHKINYLKCVSYFYNNACAEWINYSERFKMGYMPFAGSELEQPAKFVELMELVDNLKAEHRIIIEEKAKKYGK
jgi:hypothetical protein